MNEKRWRVYLYEDPYDEHLTAASAEEAEFLAMKKVFAGDYSKASDVVVKRECEECEYENERDDTKCDVCGAKL